MIAALLLLILVVILLYIRSRNAGKNLPPGPWGLPIVGYLPWLDAQNPHLTLTKLAQRYGPIFGLQLGGIYTVVLSDVKLVKKVLAMEAATGRAPLHLTHGIMQGYGLICAEGNLWKDQRRFVAGCLRQFGATKFGARRDELTRKIQRQVDESLAFVGEHCADDGDGLDPLDVFADAIGNFMNDLVLGVTYERNDTTWKYLKHLQEEGIKYLGVAGPVNFLSFLRYVPRYAKIFSFIIDGKNRQHAVYKQLIGERRVEAAAAAPQNILEAFLAERDRLPAAQAEAFYTDAQFTHLLADLIGAGLHTTLTTVGWYCMHMAANAEVQERVHAELRAVLADRRPSMDDVEALPLTMASIGEVQRFNTVVPMGIPHGAIADLHLAGYDIPAGSMILPLQWAIHSDQAIWGEGAGVFRLEHFLDADGKFHRPEGFIPYQTGKRMCVGDELARMLLFLFVVGIMRHFRITAREPIDFQGINSITYGPRPQKLIFSPR